MGSKPIWALFFLALLNSGCSCFFTYAVENLTHYPLDKVDDFAEQRRNIVMAYAAWHEIEAACPGQHSSDDYMHGFVRGYADFLYYGGKEDPPPAFPPWNYQTIHTQTPDGYMKAEAWFDGWRHGVQVAQNTGRREFMPTPISLHFPPQLLRMSYADRINFLTQRARDQERQKPIVAPADEVLPLPKVLDPKLADPAPGVEEANPGFAASREEAGPALIQTGATQQSPPPSAVPVSERGLLRRLPSAERGDMLNQNTLPERTTGLWSFLSNIMPSEASTGERGILSRRRTTETPVKP